MTRELPVLDVHHHVGNAFRANGGAVDSAEGMTPAQRLFGIEHVE